jgi:hypothetical protein
MLKQSGLPAPGPNSGYNAADIVMSFLVSIWIGGNRLTHCALLRYDEVIKKLLDGSELRQKAPSVAFFGSSVRRSTTGFFLHWNNG